MNVLFASSEAFPMVKTGGLGDVAGHLPLALRNLGIDVTLAIPGYYSILSEVYGEVIGYVSTSYGYALVREIEPETGGPRVWLVDHPLFAERQGAPYVDEKGAPWKDNSIRFGIFAQVLAKIAAGSTTFSERFDVVHCHDWQTGLVPAYLSMQKKRPVTIFTIHNLAYQGIFPASCLERLQLPGELWSPLDGLVFHGQLSFIKGGLVFADKITTVSPSYAREILSDDFSYGLAGLLNHRSADLVGIINGIDPEEWNPKTDTYIPATYDARTLENKRENKTALQRQLGLPVSADSFLIGNVGRMVEQKGINIIIDALPELMALPIQLVIAGTGDPAFEAAITEVSAQWPDKVACYIGYNESLAHLIEAGSDAFLMPSRFEPCGLNQMYSQAYGTPPIVSQTGGLQDTVTNTSQRTLAAGEATGFLMPTLDKAGLIAGVEAALHYFHEPENWTAIQQAGMRQDFSWAHSARAYVRLYREMLG